MLRAYLELLRPANVPTALADVLAGFAVGGLVNLDRLPWLLGASAALYAGGIVLNDVFDRHIDAVERPERPLPSGRVHPDQAAGLAAVLLVTGVGAAAMAGGAAAAVAGALAGAIVLYDGLGKKHAVLGPLNMGVCRGLNLLLGMAAAPAALALSWPLALLSVAYIAGVTTLSRGEVAGGRHGASAVALGLVSAVVTALLVLSLRPGRGSLAGVGLTLALAWRVLPAFWAAHRHLTPAAVRKAVRMGILSLVLVDAVLAAAYAGVGYSVVVLATAVLAGWLARFFAVT